MNSHHAVRATTGAVRLSLAGHVQGVGFRPFVYRLARECDVTGYVRNVGAGVEVHAQGCEAALAQFQMRLRGPLPPEAHIDRFDALPADYESAHTAFVIAPSQADNTDIGIAPDSATCETCLAELFDPSQRRYRYPFTTCTQCGPRYTVVERLPYDRERTTMAQFAPCAACEAEYRDPLQRRFHAQGNACAACGPRVWMCDRDGVERPTPDVFADAAARLRAGDILAMKGIGGFHLLCDARNASAVARLRQRKQRAHKALAIMAANVESVADLAEIDDAGRVQLQSAARPIVLMAKRAGCDTTLPGIAPDVACLGVVLPYTPLHYLLFHEAAGRPDGMGWLRQPQPLLLVVTSANSHGAPLIKDNDAAVAQLATIADGFVMHDRDIVTRCDDSVVRADHGRATFVRRARGYVPQSIALARDGVQVLACGAGYKNTVCVARGERVWLSQHIGDLHNRATCANFSETVAHWLRSTAIDPDVVAHDLHPDFYSTQFAQRYAQERGIEAVAIQHHHAHAAAVLAEHGVVEPALALTLDGVGWGNDGTLWGGELLHVQGATFTRLGHLRPLAMPGGDRAAREPWRMAASALHELGHGATIADRFSGRNGASLLADLLQRNVQCPRTSSAGRLFDAAAGLLGVAAVTHYEAQAAMQLEALAIKHGPAAAWERGFRIVEQRGMRVLDCLPLLERLAELRHASLGAGLFHATLIRALCDWTIQTVQLTGCRNVVLAGGCFLNALLLQGVSAALRQRGCAVFEARRVPPNDGGISLGQAWIARQLGAG